MQSNGNSAENIAAELKESTVESVDRQVRESAAEISAEQPESGGSAQPGVSGLQLFYELRDPSGALIYTGTDSDIKVTNPALWWPNGYGKTAFIHPDDSAEVARLFLIPGNTASVSAPSRYPVRMTSGGRNLPLW